MVNQLFDTPLLIDYLIGDRRAATLIEAAKHRAISVVSWLEVMCVAPQGEEEATMLFLLTFERLAASEAVADEAARIARAHPALPYHRALGWATARVNRYTFVTTNSDGIPKGAEGVEIPYRWAARKG